MFFEPVALYHYGFNSFFVVLYTVFVFCFIFFSFICAYSVFHIVNCFCSCLVRGCCKILVAWLLDWFIDWIISNAFVYANWRTCKRRVQCARVNRVYWNTHYTVWPHPANCVAFPWQQTGARDVIAAFVTSQLGGMFAFADMRCSV